MLSNTNHRTDPFAIVITPMRQGNRLPQFPWLDRCYAIDNSDWIVLAPETWQALASGDETLWADLERKLLLTYYQHQPEVIAVIGHHEDEGSDEFSERCADAADAGREEVQRIADRIRGCNLPAEVLGFWSKPGDGELIVPTPAQREEQHALWY